MDENSLLSYLPPGWTQATYQNATSIEYNALPEEVWARAAISCPCTATDTKARKQHSNSRSSWSEKSRKHGKGQIKF